MDQTPGGEILGGQTHTGDVTEDDKPTEETSMQGLQMTDELQSDTNTIDPRILNLQLNEQPGASSAHTEPLQTDQQDPMELDDPPDQPSDQHTEIQQPPATDATVAGNLDKNGGGSNEDRVETTYDGMTDKEKSAFRKRMQREKQKQQHEAKEIKMQESDSIFDQDALKEALSEFVRPDSDDESEASEHNDEGVEEAGGYAPDTVENDTSVPMVQPMPADHPTLMHDETDIYRSGTKLALILGTWANQKRLDKYLLEDIEFVSYYQPYATYLRENPDANELTKPNVVVSCMNLGEAQNKNRFSDPSDADQTTWKEPEHLARLLVLLRRHLVESQRGVFYNLGWTESVVNQRLWLMIQRARYIRRDKSKDKKAGKQRVSSLMDQYKNPSAETIRIVKKQLKKQQAPKMIDVKGNSVIKRNKSRITEQQQIEADREASAKAAGLKSIMTEDEMEALMDMNTDSWDEMMAEIEISRWRELAAKGSGHVSGNTFGRRQPMTPQLSAELFKEMYEEAGIEIGHPPPNYNDKTSPSQRYWQYKIMIGALSGGDVDLVDKAGKKISDLVAATETKKNLSHTVAAMVNDGEEPGLEAQERIESGQETDLTKDLLPLEEHQAEAGTGRITELLANKGYERTKFARACKDLNIDPRARDSKLRPTLARSTFSAFWWQITGAWNILKMYKDGYSRGALLADDMGLGKTIILAILMLNFIETAMLEFQEKAADIPREEDEKIQRVARGLRVKPFLIIVPTHLMDQWVHELRKVSKIFLIIIYHKDGEELVKNKGYGKDVQWYNANMKKDCGWLLPSLNRMKVIITTSETFAARHGPKPLDLWRRSMATAERKAEGLPTDVPFSDDEELNFKRLYTMRSHRWEGDLNGCFSGLIVDEAHNLKSEQAAGNITLSWLDAPFVALATATPITSGHWNMLGYLKLLETPENKAAFDGMDGDPYTLNLGDMSEDQKFACLSSDAWDKYMNRRNELPDKADHYIDEAEIGRRMNTVFKLIMQRRTLASHVPKSKDATMISLSIPDCYRIHMLATMNTQQKLMYDAASKRYLRRIIMTNERVLLGSRAGRVDRTMVRNSNAQRAMVGLGLCPLLGFIGVPTSHKSINKAEQEKYVLARLYANCALKVAHDNKQTKKRSRQRRPERSDADVDGSSDRDDPSTVPANEEEDPYEPFWYREGEFTFFEIDNVKWMNYYLASAPKDTDPYIWLLVRMLRQIQKHTYKGPKGEDVCGADVVHRIPNHKTAKGRRQILNMFIEWSPRLRYAFCGISDCIRRRDKMIIWVLYPFEQLFMTALIRVNGATAEPFMATLTNVARSKLSARFNTRLNRKQTASDLQFLVGNYSSGATGTNWQHQCHMVLLLDHAVTAPIAAQAGARCHRIGQGHDVYILQFTMPDTFDKVMADANERRALSNVFANIDQEALATLYHNKDGVQVQGPEEQGEVADPFAEGLGNFYELNGKMVHGSMLTSADKAGATQLSERAVLINIYRQLGGVTVDANELLADDIANINYDVDEVLEYMERARSTNPAPVEDDSDIEDITGNTQHVTVASSPSVPESWADRGTKRSRFEFDRSDVTTHGRTPAKFSRSANRRPHAQPMFMSSPAGLDDSTTFPATPVASARRVPPPGKTAFFDHMNTIGTKEKPIELPAEAPPDSSDSDDQDQPVKEHPMPDDYEPSASPVLNSVYLISEERAGKLKFKETKAEYKKLKDAKLVPGTLPDRLMSSNKGPGAREMLLYRLKMLRERWRKEEWRKLPRQEQADILKVGFRDATYKKYDKGQARKRGMTESSLRQVSKAAKAAEAAEARAARFTAEKAAAAAQAILDAEHRARNTTPEQSTESSSKSSPKSSSKSPTKSPTESPSKRSSKGSPKSASKAASNAASKAAPKSKAASKAASKRPSKSGFKAASKDNSQADSVTARHDDSDVEMMDTLQGEKTQAAEAGPDDSEVAFHEAEFPNI